MVQLVELAVVVYQQESDVNRIGFFGCLAAGSFLVWAVNKSGNNKLFAIAKLATNIH